MDSKLVVEQMSGRWKIKHPDMKPLAAEAGRVFPRGQVNYQWIPRNENKHADRLANEALDAGKAGRQWEPKPRPAAAEPEPLPAPPTVGWGLPPDLATPTTFVLLRHGETALTPEKRFSGSGGSDPELSAQGLVQAGRTAAALAARGTVQAVVSSPLQRCRQTAQAVADRLGLDVRIEDGLRETDFGAFEGLTFAEAKQQLPGRARRLARLRHHRAARRRELRRRRRAGRGRPRQAAGPVRGQDRPGRLARHTGEDAGPARSRGPARVHVQDGALRRLAVGGAVLRGRQRLAPAAQRHLAPALSGLRRVRAR